MSFENGNKADGKGTGRHIACFILRGHGRG